MSEAQAHEHLFVAKHRFARITARKARLVAGLVRGQSLNRALEMLEFTPQRAARMYLKLLRSAMANASHDEHVNVNQLVVADCRADDGPLRAGRLNWRPGPQGRALPYRRQTSHLTVGLAEREPTVEKAEKTKGKARKGNAPKGNKD